MSLAPTSSGAMVSAHEAFVSPWVLVSSSVISVLVVMVIMRGVVSFFMDMVRFLGRLFKTQYKDKEVQIEPYYPQLPAQIFMNPESEVYHISGCHHVGVRATRKGGCSLCRNKF